MESTKTSIGSIAAGLREKIRVMETRLAWLTQKLNGFRLSGRTVYEAEQSQKRKDRLAGLVKHQETEIRYARASLKSVEDQLKGKGRPEGEKQLSIF